MGQEAHPDEAFLAYCTSKGIPVDAVDFTDPRASQRIADFIKNGTRGMMRPPITVTKDTLAYVASTLWFKDAWKDEFDQRDTAVGNFHMGDGVVVQTDFMHNTINGMIVDYADCVAASLPFKHGGRMVFVLPDQDVELESLIRNGHLVAVLRSYAQMMADGTRQMASGEIRFGVPRFAAESIYERLEQSLGLGGRCDMTPMTGSDDCEIAMVHGAKIIVNEQGAEASAYAMTYAVTGAPASVPRPFTLNRPFAYMIVTDDGMPLFVGLVRDSTA